jgi:hypothetical protein
MGHPANAGGAAKDGLPRNPIVQLAFIRTSQGVLAGVPLFLQRGLFALAAWVARISELDWPVRSYIL